MWKPSLLILLALLAAARTEAAPPPPEGTEKQESANEEAPAKERAPIPRIFGGVQADFYAGDAGDTGGEDTSFFIRRARVGARGELTERIGYQVMVALDGSNSDTLAGDVKTFDAYVDVAIDDSFKLRLGQYKYSFDREGRRSAGALPLITRARVTNVLAGFLGQAGAAFRDVGAELHGKARRWTYALGVVNGNGINKRDNNDEMDYYLRAAVEPRPGLSLGAGFFQGTSTLAATGLDSDEEILTVDLLFERGPSALMAAFYSASYSRENGNDMEPEGFYVVGSHRLRPKLELALRYQEFEQNKNQQDRGFDSIDAGITYYSAPKGRWGGLKAAFNYMARSTETATVSTVWEERGAAVVGTADDVLLARFQVVF